MNNLSNKMVKKKDSALYRSLAGNLLYLTATSPDIMFASSLLSRFMHNPSQLHFGAAKSVLRYIKSTLNYSIKFSKCDTLNLHGYYDSDWGGCLDDMKSTLGYFFRLVLEYFLGH